MATIREISEKANVSIATVSKVLNGKGNVSEKTRQMILDIAQELCYRPNLNARYLKSGQSRTIGIITEDLTVFNAPEIVDGIAAACDDAGYSYILGNLRFYKRYGNGPKDLKESTALVHAAVNDMLSKQVDGIIYIGCHSHVVVSLSEHKEAKFVCAYCISEDESIPSVIYNDEQAASDVTELLIRQGDTRIGMITGPIESSNAANRTRALLARALHTVAVYQQHCGRGQELLAALCHATPDTGPTAAMLTTGLNTMRHRCAAQPHRLTGAYPPTPGGILEPRLDRPAGDYLAHRIARPPMTHRCRRSMR